MVPSHRKCLIEAICVNICNTLYTVEFRWLEPIWDHENLFETAVVRASEGYY